tara:strand:+ start:99 stop:947 length:849 start_codon:yes stop_codon:yes gene_type:complete
MYRLREIIKLFYNFIYKIYGLTLRLFGLIDFPVPPNSNMRRTSAKTIKHYIYSTLTTGLPISVAAQSSGFNFNKGANVLDFGCGCAGQLRYFLKNHPDANYYGTDIDPSTIEWVATNYPKINSSVNSPSDPLNFNDKHFDLIYTVSTFSHFSKTDVDFWLSELSRVIKDDGIFIPTIEGMGAIDLISDETKVDVELIKEELENTGIFYKNYNWLNTLQNRDIAPLHKSVDISSYFSDEYGHTVMKTDYFVKKARDYGFELLGVAEKVICDRQDLLILRKISQ